MHKYGFYFVGSDAERQAYAGDDLWDGALWVSEDTQAVWVYDTSGPSWTKVGSGSAGSVAWADITGKPTTFSPVIGAGATDAVAGNDTRLTNARAPTAHASSHQSGGSDAIKLDDLAAPDDNTDLDVSTAKHGLMPKLPNDTGKFYRGDGTFAVVPGGSEAFPVGAVFIAVVSTNPNTLLGYGTWSQIAGGRVLVGQTSGDADFDTAEETGGAKTVAAAGSVAAPTMSGSTGNESAHTHTYSQVPNHVHGVSTILRTATTGADTTQVTNAQDTSSTKDTTRKTDNPDGGVAQGTTDGGSAHSHGVGTLAASAPAFTGSPTSVVQPYLVVYIWKRTA